MTPEWWPFHWVPLTIAFVALIYIYLTWNNDYWKKRNIAFSKPMLFFGNYTDVLLGRKTVGEVMEEIYKEFEGKTFCGFWRFRHPGLIIRDPEVVKHVLLKDFTSFQQNAFYVDPQLDPLACKNAFLVYGEEWRHTRSLLTPSFTSGKLKPLLPLMEEVSAQLMEHLRSVAASSDPDGIELKDLATKYTMEMVATCAFGIKGESFKNPNAELRAMTLKILQPGFWKNLQFLIMNFLPTLGSFLQIRLVPKEVDQYYRKIIRDVVDYREKNHVTRNDFLQSLINLKRKTLENGEAFGEADLAGHALTFLTDGVETSAVVLSFLLFELARNPHVQEQLRQDVAAARREEGGKLSYEALMELPLMEQVLQETLRLHAPLMAMEKVCTRATALRGADGSEVRVERGTLVVVPVRALHRDPRFHPDPERFDPARFAPDRREQITKFTHLPFGEGPRMCLGMRFAMTQIKLAVSSIVERFNIKATSKTAKRVVQDPTFFLTCAKGGIWARFEERQVDI